jgi:hypothetical protein
MGNATSTADIIIELRNIDLNAWGDRQGLIDAIERVSTNGRAATPEDAALLRLINALFAERDLLGNDVAQVAAVRASHGLELSAQMADHYIAESARALVSGVSGSAQPSDKAAQSAKAADKFDALFD